MRGWPSAGVSFEARGVCVRFSWMDVCMRNAAKPARIINDALFCAVVVAVVGVCVLPTARRHRRRRRRRRVSANVMCLFVRAQHLHDQHNIQMCRSLSDPSAETTISWFTLGDDACDACAGKFARAPRRPLPPRMEPLRLRRRAAARDA